MSDLFVKLHSGSTQIKFESLQVGTDALVVTDSNLSSRLSSYQPIVVPAGEQSKNLQQYESILDQLSARGAKRKTKLVAVGGGVIGDLVGFAAATYMRGIPLIQVPTTLLAMVDSSVGGKVGIDTDGGKNLVGAFHPAQVVYVDVSWLKTLPQRQWACGMAEVIKYGLIMDAELHESLSTSPMTEMDELRSSDVIRRCIELKKKVVEADEFETTGYRAILNFGHTIGHAIEKLTNYEQYTHGEAIAVGMYVESIIGEKLGLSTPGLAKEVAAILEAHSLPTNSLVLKDVENIIQSMRGDKKSVRGEISMSLVTQIGEARLVHDIPESLVREVLSAT